MAPKGKKGTSSEGNKAGDEDREESLQAVVLTDSFETRFSPFTLEKPRCLLPLANTPLIEYTLEFLANAGVKDVFVYCGAHVDQVEQYFQESPWSSKLSPFAKLAVLRSTSRSVGDAMRDLDKRGILTGDFVLVYGDVVSNYPLDAALTAHRARRATNKDAIMTMVLREVGVRHRTKAQDALPVFVIDPSKDRCLNYEQIHRGQSGKFVHVEPSILAEHQAIEVRQDLIDCGIDICTPDVLALWSDNFDFEVPRRGFLYSVLKDHELNGKTIHTHIMRDHYAARARSLRAYDAVSKDVISRWTYPLCPDSNLVRGQSYRLHKGNVHKEEGVILARSCVINPRTVIGKDSAIGDGSVISNSVIGRRCFIGRNVTVDGAFIWDDAVVGEGSTVRQAIIANEAMVGKGCKIEPGALISFGVRVGDGITVHGSSRLMKELHSHDGNASQKDKDENVVGKDGEGFEFYDSDEDESGNIEQLISRPSVYDNVEFAVSAESISTLNSEISEEPAAPAPRRASGSFISLSSDEGQPSHHATDFHHDAVASIFDSLQKGDNSANIQLELTALRMSTNASEHQVRRAVVTAFMKRVAQLAEAGTSVKQAVSEAFKEHKGLVSRTMFDRDREEKSDQVDFLSLMQADLVHRKDGDSILLFVSNELYTSDILEAEAFEQWWKRDEEGKEDVVRVRAKMPQFMDVLLADTESESEGDEDDDNEEEDE